MPNWLPASLYCQCHNYIWQTTITEKKHAKAHLVVHKTALGKNCTYMKDQGLPEWGPGYQKKKAALEVGEDSFSCTRPPECHFWWRSWQPKVANKMGKPRNPLQNLVRIKGWPILHSLNLVGIHAHPLRRDEEPQKWDQLCLENTFLHLDKKIILWRTSLTCWTCFWGEEENINMSSTKTYMNWSTISLNTNNECLENRRWVGQAERHNLIFKVSPRGVKCPIPLPYADQMIVVAQVQFSEKRHPLQPLEGQRQQQQRICLPFRSRKLV